MTWQQSLCGKHSFKPWNDAKPGLCFNQVVVCSTTNIFLAVASAFYAGKRRKSPQRSLHERRASIVTYLKVFLCAAMTLSYVVEEIVSGIVNDEHPPALWFGLATGGLAWFLHAFLIRKSRFSLNIREPFPVLLAWFFTLLSSAYQLFSALEEEPWPGDRPSGEWVHGYGMQHVVGVIVRFSIQIIYLVTLIIFSLKRKRSILHIQESDEEVRRPLLRQLDPMHEEEKNPEENASLFSRLFFYWVGSLMADGSKGNLDRPEKLMSLPSDVKTSSIRTRFGEQLRRVTKENFLVENGNEAEEEKEIDDLYQLKSTLSVSQSRLSSAIDFASSSNLFSDAKKGEEEVRNGRQSKTRSRTLLTALNRTFGWSYYPLGLLKLFADLLAFAGPFLLNELVKLIEEKKRSSEGYYYALGLVLATFLSSILQAQFTYLVNRVSVQVKGAVITSIYQKALSVNMVRLQKFSTGEIVNFMSTDTDRIVNFCQSFHQFWSLPFQVAIALYLLYQQVHLAFLAGLGLALLLIPVNRWVAVKIGQLSKEMMSQKDARVKVMSELLAGIRVIKYYAWEKCFKAKILSLRDLELKSLKGRKYLDALCVYFWATTPVLMSILTFLTFSLVHKGQLTAARVFTSVALFNMLISPLNAFPWVINGLVEAWVSLKRVQEFMWLHDLNLAAYYCDEPLRLFPLDSLTPESDDPAIDISLGRFSWQHLERGKKTQAALKDISLTIQPGQLIGICGRVGAGKSSLLAAIIGEMRKTNGKIFVNNLPEGFAYAAQEAWLQHATVRDNILFGMAFDEEKYSRVIEGCALQEDLAILPAGDLTEVGENGVTLSGGQKARVALARAVYQDKSIYLLDDPLAAVDANVGAHLFNQCILGLLKGKTRLLCTHHTQFLSSADVVIAIEKGRIAMAGRPEDVLSEQLGFRPAKTVEVDESGSRLYEEKAKDNVTKVHSQKDGEDAEIRHEKGILVKEEEKEVGAVAFHVYKSYWLAIGNCLATAILISMFLMQASRNVNDWWLSYWVTATSHASNSSLHSVDLLVVSNSWWYSNRPSIGTGNANETERTLTFYLGVYGALAGANSIFTLFRAFLYAYGGICAATSIHRQLLLKILYAPVAFFDITPIGRIINRFSSDVYAIDDSLPFMLNILLAQLFGVLGTIAITCYGLPWFALALLPLGIIYYFIQRYYRRTSRELKRLSSVTRSPIYAHFSESLTGLESIRAYRQTERFAKENEEKLDVNQRANFGEYAASQWLSIRLQMLGVTMVGAVAFIAVLEHQYGTVNPGLVGLALSYALSVTALLSGVVTSFTETEKLMVSVERAEQYISGLPKEPERMTNALPGWPSHGIVTFRKVTLIYREGLPPALNELTFQTRPYEKVGIVGRTGAGKSSLFSCLFQMTEISSGEILIDGIDVSNISQQSLRSRLAVIPQDPFLFSGTIRQNLDPSSKARDAELRFVLAKCHLLDAVDALGGLDVDIGERGRQFSVGERQLLCLARAMLTQTKVLCIDEATASVDKQTDSWLQQAIRQEFAYSTVLTIAHRIETILDSDRVLVMDRGHVAEFAKPDLLLSDPNSLFSQLVNSSEI